MIRLLMHNSLASKAEHCPPQGQMNHFLFKTIKTSFLLQKYLYLSAEKIVLVIIRSRESINVIGCEHYSCYMDATADWFERDTLKWLFSYI